MENSRKSPSSELLQAGWLACAGELVQPGQRLVVGLSGGIDSMSLLHWLSRNWASQRNPLSALHVNHGISENADAWADSCHVQCAAIGVPLTVARVEVERGSRDGLEGAARRARREAYAQTNGDWIVLAHHRGDQTETLLFNLLRGCGVRGAGAMRPRHGRLLRPWLGVGRAVIEDYATHEGLHWVEDESNTDVRYNRNFLRHRILPTISERFPTAEERLAAASSHFVDAQQLLDELAQIDLAGTSATFPIPVATLATLNELRAGNVLAYLLRTSGVAVSNKKRLTEALRQLITAGPDRHPSVRFGEYHLLRQRDIIDLSLRPSINLDNIDNNESGEES